MIRSLVFSLVLLLAAGAALAQFRTIPADAKRGVMSHVEGMTVEIDGKKVQLAIGARIRDDSNRLVEPTAVPPRVLVKYMPDPWGQVSRIWILSSQEAAQPDPEK